MILGVDLKNKKRRAKADYIPKTQGTPLPAMFPNSNHFSKIHGEEELLLSSLELKKVQFEIPLSATKTNSISQQVSGEQFFTEPNSGSSEPLLTDDFPFIREEIEDIRMHFEREFECLESRFGPQYLIYQPRKIILMKCEREFLSGKTLILNLNSFIQLLDDSDMADPALDLFFTSRTEQAVYMRPYTLDFFCQLSANCEIILFSEYEWDLTEEMLVANMGWTGYASF